MSCTIRNLVLMSALCVAAFAHAAQPGHFEVRDAATRLVDGVYQLNASIDYELSAEALEALENGVTLTLKVVIDVTRPRKYVWDDSVATLVQRYELSYHALARRYIVKNVNSGEQDSYPSRAGALAAVGTIRDLPLLDRKLLNPALSYEVRVRAVLDLNALPGPLRVLAYVTRNWHLSSEWYPCPLDF